MDGRRFDRLTKTVARRGITRRGLLGLLAGGLVVVLGGDRGGQRSRSSLLGGTPEPGEGPQPCATAADCGGPPWECRGTGHGANCFDPSRAATPCGPTPANCAANGAACGGGDCTTQCEADAGCLAGKCVTERASAGAPPCSDLVAACVQPTDAGLTGDWQIVAAAWTDRVAALAALPPALRAAVQRRGGGAAAAVLTLGQVEAQGTVTRIVKTALVRCADAAAAQAIAAAYTDATANRVTRLDTSGLPADAADARVALYETSADPDLVRELRGAPAAEVTFHDGMAVGVLTISGADAGPIVGLAAGLIGRLTTGATPGGDLMRGVVYVAGVTTAVDVWYSRLGTRPQRYASVTDDQWARQQETEGVATDFAHARQAIPSTETGSDYRLATWAGRCASPTVAQAWLAATPQRLATQHPDVQFIAITEADGMGEAALGFRYTVMRADGVAIGVDLYARVGPMLYVVGLSLSAGQMTPGVSPLFADARPLGKAAQVVLGVQLQPPDPQHCDPRGVAVGDVFGDSPLPVATP